MQKNKSQIFLRLTFFVMLSALTSCGPKTPLSDERGFLQVMGAYQVQEEGVSYVFFEIHENPEILANIQLFYATDTGFLPPSGEQTNWQKIDFATDGVHQHRLLGCASKTLCGSFSWPSDLNTYRVHLKMLYHPEGSTTLQDSSSLIYMSTPSVTSFGVFDGSNEHVQIRNEDNFGIPNRLAAPNYGMTRRFVVRGPAAATVSADAMKTLASTQQHNYLFPATFCNTDHQATVVKDFLGYKSWLADTYSMNDGTNGVCFGIDYLDRNGRFLVHHTGFARRNPRFNSGSYRYTTPLTTAVKVPIVIAYCSDATGADTARDQTFLDYQKVLIGTPSAAEDLCFSISSADSFRVSFRNLLAAKLSAAKTSSTGLSDFVYTIVLHQNLTSEFRTIHQIIAEETTTIINAEDALSSPRLVGAFVYDSRSDFKPTSEQQKRIIWCPQTRPIDPSKPITEAEDANCIVQDVAKIDLQFLNFVVSMGPFPTLTGYKDYVAEHGDRGVARSPELSFASVPQNGMTFHESETQTVTYFDSEKLVIGASNYARVCWEKEGASLLNSLRLRELGQDAATPGLTMSVAESSWRAGVGLGTYRIGVAWDQAFVGKVTYRSSLLGTFVSVIPFSQSFSSYQMLGDTKWLMNDMDIGNLIQVCSGFCQHPYFDEAGNYQVSVNYNNAQLTGCVTPKYPVLGE